MFVSCARNWITEIICQKLEVDSKNSEVAKFFNYSPKRQRLLQKVIEVTQPEAKRTKLHDLCRTRWVERHLAYEIYLAVSFPHCHPADVMLHEAINRVEHGVCTWYRESLTTANHHLTS